MYVKSDKSMFPGASTPADDPSDRSSPQPVLEGVLPQRWPTMQGARTDESDVERRGFGDVRENTARLVESTARSRDDRSTNEPPRGTKSTREFTSCAFCASLRLSHQRCSFPGRAIFHPKTRLSVLLMGRSKSQSGSITKDTCPSPTSTVWLARWPLETLTCRQSRSLPVRLGGAQTRPRPVNLNLLPPGGSIVPWFTVL